MDRPKLGFTDREHGLITDMEGTYEPLPQTRTVRVTFSQAQREVVEMWCQKAKEMGAKRCTITQDKKTLVHKAQLYGENARIVARRHLQSEGIITAKHRTTAEKVAFKKQA